MKKFIIILFIIFTSHHLFSQQLPAEVQSLAKTALDCFDKEDYQCSIINLEKVLNKYGSQLTNRQSKAIKKVLISSYYSLAMERGKSNNPNFKDLCIKGIRLGKEINETNDLNAFMFHYMIIAYYRYLENETKMNEWIEKFNIVSKNLNIKPEIKRQILDWANSNIRYMKRSLNDSGSSISYGFSLGDLISKTSNNKKKTSIYKKKSSNTIVKKTIKCCNETYLGSKVVLYYLYTNKNEKISIYYYPHLDKWHFKNGWGEKFRGNKFYDNLEDIIHYIENE